MHVFFGVVALAAAGADKEVPQPSGPQTFTHRVAGLFQPDRADDLRAAMKEHPSAELLDVDYDHARATFRYDPKVVSTDSLNQFLGRTAFGLLPPTTTSADKLTTIEIGIVGLDCRGCGLGCYNIVYKLDGVDHATVSFREGRLVATVDPAKITRAGLEEELKKKQVTLKTAGVGTPGKK